MKNIFCLILDCLALVSISMVGFVLWGKADYFGLFLWLIPTFIFSYFIVEDIKNLKA